MTRCFILFYFGQLRLVTTRVVIVHSQTHIAKWSFLLGLIFSVHNDIIVSETAWQLIWQVVVRWCEIRHFLGWAMLRLWLLSWYRRRWLCWFSGAVAFDYLKFRESALCFQLTWLVKLTRQWTCWLGRWILVAKNKRIFVCRNRYIDYHLWLCLKLDRSVAPC